jgi:hypothetical protein
MHNLYRLRVGPVFNVDPQKRLAYAGGGAGTDRVFAPTEVRGCHARCECS